jgi:hypothetical protein
LEAAFHDDKDRLTFLATRGKRLHRVFERIEATSLVLISDTN